MAIADSFLEFRGLQENMNRQSRTRPGRPSVFDRPVIGLGDSVRHVGASSGLRTPLKPEPALPESNFDSWGHFDSHHCTEAGLADKAVTYWHRAGEWAVERSAYAEAIDHLRTGLKPIDGLPDAGRAGAGHPGRTRIV